MPGEIDNSDLYQYILYARAERTIDHQYDDDLQLGKGDDYFQLSPALWRFFYDLYGCRHIIQIRYYRSATFLNNDYEGMMLSQRSILESVSSYSKRKDSLKSDQSQ
jgi:hypothetical protein